jgi:4'-phosphopantetheinyl transferase EntD
MGVILHKNIDEGDCVLGMWEITEDYDTLMQMVNLTESEICRVNSFRSHTRKLEWLSVRALVVSILGPGMRIVYNEKRKPFLSDNSYNISISHSKKYTSIFLSKKKRVGIDLEFMSHDIEKVSRYFINENEVITNNASLRPLHIYIHWCAKEALYKICDKQDIHFRKNLTLSSFEPLNEGRFRGTVHNMYGIEHFDMNFTIMNNYVIVWCTK